MITPRVSLRSLLIAALVLGAGGCMSRCGDKGGGGSATPVAAPTATPAPTPADLLVEGLADLRDRAGLLPDGSTAAGGPDAESFRNTARQLGEDAITAKRPDIAAEVGRALMNVGDLKLAEAFLQRAVGLLKPSEAGKEHIYPLAEIKRASGRPLEAASLYERAIDIEPTTAAEFVGLSDIYLSAARLGPARAAVTRGLRKHPDDQQLKVQGAKVKLLDPDGSAEEALAAVDAVLGADGSDFGAKLVRTEILLALGRIDDASEAAGELRSADAEDAWGYLFGAAVLRAQGKADEAETLLTKARELAGDCSCTHEERLAIEWAAKVAPGDHVSPRSRAEVDPPAPPKSK